MGFKYNDKKTIIPKTNNDNTLDKKELLMKQFVSKTTGNKKSTTSINKSIEPIDKNNVLQNEIIKLKERIKTLEKQVITYKQKVKEFNLKNNSGKDKINKYYDLYIQTKEELNKNISDYTKKLNESKEKYEELKLYSSKYEDIIQGLRKEIEYNKSENEKLSKSKSSMQGILRSKNLSYMKTAEENETLLKEISKLNKTIKYSNTTIKSLELDKTLLTNRIELLETLNKAYKYSQLDKERKHPSVIKYIYSSIKKTYKNFINSIRFRYNAYTEKNRKLGNDMYGTIQTTLFGYKVTDFTTNKSYTVVGFKDKYTRNLLNGYSCVFRLNRKDKAIVFNVFRNMESLDSFRTNVIASKNKRIKKIKSANIKYNISYKILIISALPPSSYLKKLNSLGINIDIFNSYYENAKRLNSILQSYDLVIYCTDTSKHYVKGIFKNQSDFLVNRDKYIFLSEGSATGVLNVIDNFIEKKGLIYENKDESIVSDIN